jgi:hypothetical protein
MGVMRLVEKNVFSKKIMKVSYGNDQVTHDVTRAFAQNEHVSEDNRARMIIFPADNRDRASMLDVPVIENAVWRLEDDFGGVQTVEESTWAALKAEAGEAGKYRFVAVDTDAADVWHVLMSVEPIELRGALVLEVDTSLDGDSGSLSCMLASRGAEVMSVKIDEAASEAAKEKRDANGHSFQVHAGVISSCPLVINVEVIKPAHPWDDKDTWRTIPTITYDDFCEKYPVFASSLDVLVLKTNKHSKSVLQDYPVLLKKVHTVVINNDFMFRSDEREVRELLEIEGFQCVLTAATGSVQAPFKRNMHEVWKRE